MTTKKKDEEKEGKNFCNEIIWYLVVLMNAI
jgi:hypothetical protein